MANEVEGEKKKKIFESVYRIIMGVAIGIILFIGIILWIQYGDGIKRVAGFTPNPEISSNQCNDNSTIGDVSALVEASIINRGSEGSIVVEATVTQGQGSWTKTEILFLTKNETGNVRIPFDEVSFGGGDIHCSLRAYAN